VKLVFVQNRNKRREWLVVLSTDVTLGVCPTKQEYAPSVANLYSKSK
jgi:hypothetical protein